jgi:tetratricopeptide (TPR) repeat protein
MTFYHPLWAPPTPPELTAGRAAAERALSVGAQTDRERAYIAAIHAFYADPDRLDHRTRSSAYRAAMERTADAFPEDDEASIFYALALLGAAPPSDPDYASQKQAAAILERELRDDAQHPGIAHYTIHAFDYPELAELALPAARIYADLAPGSAHALHMPTHIFTRLGLWEESISANVACRDAATAMLEAIQPERTSFEALHCQDYLAYAYLQIGEDERALRVLEGVASASRFDDPNFAAGYALLAVPARYALERRDWSSAAGLDVPDVDLPWQYFRESHGSTFFTNAIGAARSGDVARARTAVERLERLRDELAASALTASYDWAGQVESMRLAASGWLAFAEGRTDEAVQLLSSAAAKEESVGKHPVTPGPIVPARELLGDLLLELGSAPAALEAYEATLRHSPGRFSALAGAARAARAAGNAEKAAEYFQALLAQAGRSSSPREELTEARAFLAGRP